MSRTKPKLHGTITVFGVKIRVRESRGIEDHGQFHLNAKGGPLILINPDGPDPMSTLKHEMFHAALDISGWSEQVEKEEGLIIALEIGAGPHTRIKWDKE